MKITITPFEKREEKLDTITLYNLIKRSQEDLLSNYPSLKEFILEVRMHPTFIKYNSMPKCLHSVCDDESAITLMIASYPLQEPKKVYQQISDKLFVIKTQ